MFCSQAKAIPTFKSIAYSLVPSEAPGTTLTQKFRVNFGPSFPQKGTEDH